MKHWKSEHKNIKSGKMVSLWWNMSTAIETPSWQWCFLSERIKQKAIKMQIRKVYHRFSLPSYSVHHHLIHRPSPLSPPSFLCLRPSKFPDARSSCHLRVQSAIPGNPFRLSPSMSRIRTLVPIEAVSGENAAATGSNGSASNSQYEGCSSFLSMIFRAFSLWDD